MFFEKLHSVDIGYCLIHYGKVVIQNSFTVHSVPLLFTCYRLKFKTLLQCIHQFIALFTVLRGHILLVYT